MPDTLAHTMIYKTSHVETGLCEGLERGIQAEVLEAGSKAKQEVSASSSLIFCQ